MPTLSSAACSDTIGRAPWPCHGVVGTTSVVTVSSGWSWASLVRYAICPGVGAAPNKMVRTGRIATIWPGA